MAKQYRALEKLEWPHPKKRGEYVVVAAGEEFDEPPEAVNVEALIKAKAVERVKDGEK